MSNYLTETGRLDYPFPNIQYISLIPDDSVVMLLHQLIQINDRNLCSKPDKTGVVRGRGGSEILMFTRLPAVSPEQTAVMHAGSAGVLNISLYLQSNSWR